MESGWWGQRERCWVNTKQLGFAGAIRYSYGCDDIGVIMDKKEVKKIADTEVKAHEKRLHGMKKGGPTSLDRKKYGKNMSRAMNQR